jgi:hypothetical protein
VRLDDRHHLVGNRVNEWIQQIVRSNQTWDAQWEQWFGHLELPRDDSTGDQVDTESLEESRA